ncbi:MAG: hypothetical protein AAB405_02565 [Patescibacteria group bacterium]
MTIIQPNKNSFKIEFFISIVMLIFIASAVWGVFLYNQTVNFKHETENISKILKQSEIENAELKNILYSMIDLKSSESLVISESLVLEKDPEYIKTASEQQLTINN